MPAFDGFLPLPETVPATAPATAPATIATPPTAVVAVVATPFASLLAMERLELAGFLAFADALLEDDAGLEVEADLAGVLAVALAFGLFAFVVFALGAEALFFEAAVVLDAGPFDAAESFERCAIALAAPVVLAAVFFAAAVLTPPLDAVFAGALAAVPPLGVALLAIRELPLARPQKPHVLNVLRSEWFRKVRESEATYCAEKPFLARRAE